MSKTKDEFSIQREYWAMMAQTKFELYYYHEIADESLTITRWLSYPPTIITIVATVFIINWSDNSTIKALCPGAIIIMEIIENISGRLPYNSRRQDLSELIDEINDVFIDMEADWREIADGRYTHSSINAKIHHYSKLMKDIRKHYLKNDSLPERKKARLRAQQKMEEYFKDKEMRNNG